MQDLNWLMVHVGKKVIGLSTETNEVEVIEVIDIKHASSIAGKYSFFKYNSTTGNFIVHVNTVAKWIKGCTTVHQIDVCRNVVREVIEARFSIYMMNNQIVEHLYDHCMGYLHELLTRNPHEKSD